jgi:hypothetical protein
MIARLSALPDRALWLAIGGALFALSAWPLLLVELPPLQDLPNHVASAYIAQRLDSYPEYVFNGFAKSNSLLQFWLEQFDDLLLGARLFTALALAAMAFALPWFALQIGGRRAMVAASLFGWPLVHGFCLSMGMLNFAFGVPVSLVVLALLDRQRGAMQSPSPGAPPPERVARTVARGLVIVALSLVVWFAHPFPLIVVGALVLLESVVQVRRGGLRLAAALVLPLAPLGALVAGTALLHLVKAEGAPAATQGLAYLTPWELIAHFWLDASGSLTRWSTATVIPAILLPVFAWRGRKDDRPLVGNRAAIALIVGYLGLPLMISNWWYLNTRLMPFVWVVLALRVPPVLPRRVVAVLVAGALAFSVTLGIDYVRLDRDRAEFTAGIEAVPERATLLPLLFKHRKTSELTASLTHTWGFYVLARQTSAPLVFAVERSYPITYRSFPPPAVIPPALDRFAELHATPALACAAEASGSVGLTPTDCDELWRLEWAQFWRVAEPRFTHLLVWAMPPASRSLIPPSYHRVFARGDLEIYAKQPAAAVR